MAETETLTVFLETRPRRDVGTCRDRLETKTKTETTALGNSDAVFFVVIGC